MTGMYVRLNTASVLPEAPIILVGQGSLDQYEANIVSL
jgi:hypothetical protein